MDDFNENVVIENVGGCDGFMFIDINQVDAISWSGMGVVEHAIALKSGNRFFKGFATLGSLSFEETVQENAQGKLYTTSIKGKYPRPDQNMIKLFTRLAFTRTIVTILDNNCNLRIAGSEHVGLKFNYKESSGVKGADRNGIDFEFTRQGVKPSPYYVAPAGSPGMEIV